MSLHKPVLLKEVIEKLNLKEGQKVVDCTLGGGGHTREILKKIGKSGQLLAIDQDEEAIKNFQKEISSSILKIKLINDNFSNLESILQKNKFLLVDAIFADFGFSTDQIFDKKKGLSFLRESPLDMRYGKKQKTTAQDIINGYSKEELINIFKNYGEEPLAEKIVKVIVKKRKKEKIISTQQLANIILSVKRRRGKIHPATQVFQALRIEVNDELEVIKKFLPQAVKVLKPTGRLVIITFHSLEDRIVKRFFKKISLNTHACRVKESGEKKGSPDSLDDFLIKLINKKVIKPKWEELKRNRKARSAKLRVVEKI